MSAPQWILNASPLILDADVMDSLKDSTLSVLSTLLGNTTFNCSQLPLTHGSGFPVVNNDILAMVPMRQENQTQEDALFCLALPTASISRFLPSTMVPSSEHCTDAISALTNMIFGMLKTFLNGRGYTYQPSLIKTIVAEDAVEMFCDKTWTGISYICSEFRLNFYFCVRARSDRQ